MPNTVPLGLIEIAANAVAQGVAAATEMVREELGDIPTIGKVEDWINAIARCEVATDAARARLIRLRDRGLSTPVDFAHYDLLRDNLLALQQRANRVLREVFSGVPELVSRLPEPKRAPSVEEPVPVDLGAVGAQVWSLQGHSYGRAPGQGGAFGDRFTALGTPTAVPAAGAAAAAGGWMWGVAVLALLAVIVVAVVIAGTLMAESIRDTLVALDSLEKQANAAQLRESCYEQCLAAGDAENTPALCAAHCIQLHPMPRVPKLPAPGGWVKWVAAAVITVVVVGGLVYLVRAFRRRGGRARELRGSSRPAYRRLTPGQFLEGDSDYGLET